MYLSVSHISYFFCSFSFIVCVSFLLILSASNASFIFHIFVEFYRQKMTLSVVFFFIYIVWSHWRKWVLSALKRHLKKHYLHLYNKLHFFSLCSIRFLLLFVLDGFDLDALFFVTAFQWSKEHLQLKKKSHHKPLIVYRAKINVMT